MAILFHYQTAIRTYRLCGICLVAGVLRTSQLNISEQIHIHAGSKGQTTELGRLNGCVRSFCSLIVEDDTRSGRIHFLLLLIAHRHYNRGVGRQRIVTGRQRIVIRHEDNDIRYARIIVRIRNSVFQLRIRSSSNSADTYTVCQCRFFCPQEIAIAFAIFHAGRNVHFGQAFRIDTIVIIRFEIAGSEVYRAV